jgi:hypothetical protein
MPLTCGIDHMCVRVLCARVARGANFFVLLSDTYPIDTYPITIPTEPMPSAHVMGSVVGLDPADTGFLSDSTYSWPHLRGARGGDP